MPRRLETSADAATRSYDLRRRLGMSQREFAAWLGVSQVTINNYETPGYSVSSLGEALLSALERELDK